MPPPSGEPALLSIAKSRLSSWQVRSCTPQHRTPGGRELHLPPSGLDPDLNAAPLALANFVFVGNSKELR